MHVRETLRETRKRQGFTQREVAEKAGISQSYYAEIETGKKQYNEKQLGQIARALNISVSDFFVSEGGGKGTSASVSASRGGQGGAIESEVVGGPDTVLRLEVAADGTLRLPPGVMQGLEIEQGGTLSGRLADGRLVLSEPVAALRRLQGALAHLKRPGESVVDEFLKERRAMWGEE